MNITYLWYKNKYFYRLDKLIGLFYFNRIFVMPILYLQKCSENYVFFNILKCLR